MTDQEMVEGCIRGKEEAYRQLYDAFSSEMMGVCMRYTGSNAEAQDVLHDGLISVYSKLGGLRDVKSLKGWIRSIMVHTAIDHLNRRKLHLEPIDAVEVESTAVDYDRFNVEYLLSIIQSLPDRYRLVFNLHEVEGYSFEEISRQLSVEQSTVRSILFRARKMIQNKIDQDER